MNRIRGAGLSGMMVLALGAAACGGRDTNEADSLAMGASGMGNSAAAATASTMDFSQMSDANIASTVAVLNGGEILLSELADAKAQSAEVKQYGRDMVTQHRAMQATVDSLATAKNIEPQPIGVAETIQNQMNTERQRLEGMSGADFDRAFMQAQVTAHQQALDAHNAMVSAVQDPDMRATIQAAIPKVQEHLERARALSNSTGSTTGGTATDTARRH